MCRFISAYMYVGYEIAGEPQASYEVGKLAVGWPPSMRIEPIMNGQPAPFPPTQDRERFFYRDLHNQPIGRVNRSEDPQIPIGHTDMIDGLQLRLILSDDMHPLIRTVAYLTPKGMEKARSYVWQVQHDLNALATDEKNACTAANKFFRHRRKCHLSIDHLQAGFNLQKGIIEINYWFPQMHDHLMTAPYTPDYSLKAISNFEKYTKGWNDNRAAPIWIDRTTPDLNGLIGECFSGLGLVCMKALMRHDISDISER